MRIAWITSVDPRVTIQPDLLRPGHYYAAVINAILGNPKAGQGDFATVAFPSGYEVTVPGTFVPALPQPPK